MPGVDLVGARNTGDESVGFLLQRRAADEAELLLLAVAPAHRKRGIGRMLLDRFILDAMNKGIARLHLEVRDGNPAVRMYLAAGFCPVGRRRKYYRGSDGEQYDALTLALQT
jgi:ribosomal-protein-alanine N-acetyltransferase